MCLPLDRKNMKNGFRKKGESNLLAQGPNKVANKSLPVQLVKSNGVSTVGAFEKDAGASLRRLVDLKRDFLDAGTVTAETNSQSVKGSQGVSEVITGKPHFESEDSVVIQVLQEKSREDTSELSQDKSNEVAAVTSVLSMEQPLGAALNNVACVALSADALKDDAGAALSADALYAAVGDGLDVAAGAVLYAAAGDNLIAAGAALYTAAGGDLEVEAGTALCAAAGDALDAAAGAVLDIDAGDKASFEQPLEAQVELGDDVLAINKGLGDVLASPQDSGSVSLANRGRDLLEHSALESGVDMNCKVGFSASRTEGDFRSTLIHKEVMVEPRQSERIKKQQSGDEDLVQKAIRRAKMRNLESSNPSYPFDRTLAESLGKPAETRPEGIHAGWKYPSGGYGEANFICSWMAV